MIPKNIEHFHKTQTLPKPILSVCLQDFSLKFPSAEPTKKNDFWWKFNPKKKVLIKICYAFILKYSFSSFFFLLFWFDKKTHTIPPFITSLHHHDKKNWTKNNSLPFGEWMNEPKLSLSPRNPQNCINCSSTMRDRDGSVGYLNVKNYRKLCFDVKISRRRARQFAKLNVVNGNHFFMCWIWWYCAEHLLRSWYHLNMRHGGE